MSTENVLEIRGLRSSFFTDNGEVPAVNDVDLVIPRGKLEEMEDAIRQRVPEKFWDLNQRALVWSKKI